MQFASTIFLLALWGANALWEIGSGPYPENTPVYKESDEFEDEWLEGYILGFDADMNTYEVKWSDETTEDIDAETAGRYVENEDAFYESEEKFEDEWMGGEMTDPNHFSEGVPVYKETDESEDGWLEGEIVGFDADMNTYEVKWLDETTEVIDAETAGRYVENEEAFFENEEKFEDEWMGGEMPEEGPDQYPENTPVYKESDKGVGGWLDGYIVKFDAEKNTYKVMWSDMTTEDVDAETAERYVENEEAFFEREDEVAIEMIGGEMPESGDETDPEDEGDDMFDVFPEEEDMVEARDDPDDEDDDEPYSEMTPVYKESDEGLNGWIEGYILGFDAATGTYEVMWPGKKSEDIDVETADRYVENQGAFYDAEAGDMALEEELEYEEEERANGSMDDVGVDGSKEYHDEDFDDEDQYDYEIGTAVAKEQADGTWKTGEIVAFGDGYYEIEWDIDGTIEAFPNSGATIDELVDGATTLSSNPDEEETGYFPSALMNSLGWGKHVIIAVVVVAIAIILHFIAKRHVRNKKLEELSLSTTESSAFIKGKNGRPETRLSVQMDRDSTNANRSII
jgi:hypothetical protein